MSHAYVVLAALEGAEKQRFEKALSQPLSALSNWYVTAGELAAHMMDAGLIGDRANGKSWREAAGYTSRNTPVPGIVFSFPLGRTEENLDIADQNCEALLGVLHERGCRAVRYTHLLENGAAEQYCVFLPNMKLPDKGDQVQYDLDGKITFLATLLEKKLLTESDIPDEIKHSSFGPRIIAESKTKREGWAAGR